MGKCNCGKRALYGFSYGKAIYCCEHKLAGMEDVVTKRCIYTGCTVIKPSFDIPNGNGTYCARHKLDGMEDVKHKRCQHIGCTKRPTFGASGGKVTYCKDHKLEGMEDVINKRCAHIDCKVISPAFDYLGGKGIYCLEHKLPNMINVIAKTCAFAGCVKRPTYGEIGSNGTYCVIHKSLDMTDVKSRKCQHPTCIKQPSYNFHGLVGIYCAGHKLPGMENVRGKQCAHSGCHVGTPVFDHPGGKGKYCVAHKLDGMIDVKHNHCEHNGCTTRARYGRPGTEPSHCAQHRQNGMLRNPTARCIICKNKQAIYGKNYTPTHCEEHQADGDVNLVERACVSCGLLYILDSNDRCELCNPETFTKARLQKQNALMAALDSRKDLPTPVSTDRLIDGGACGKERPDRVYDLGDKILIVECDEHQHRDRQCLCEQTRMVNIAQSYGGLPVYFIRWNPDGYSPFNQRKQLDILGKRHKMAGDLIRDINAGNHLPPVALCAAIYLYYDDWDGIMNESWKVLTPIIL